MRISLSLIASAILVVWMVEYFGYNAGDDIHYLLLIAILIFLMRVFLVGTMERLSGKPRIQGK